VNDPINGAALPKNTKVPNPKGKTTHNVTHRHAKMDKISDMLEEADKAGTVHETLKLIKMQLYNGTF